jgi:hypothetical protein
MIGLVKEGLALLPLSIPLMRRIDEYEVIAMPGRMDTVKNT